MSRWMGVVLLGVLSLAGCAGQGQQLPPLAGQARDLHAEGIRLLEAGEIEDARQKLEEARRLAESLDDRKRLAQILNAFGKAAIRDRDNGLTVAKNHHEQALSIARSLEDAPLEAESLAYLGQVAHIRGKRKTARARYEEALQIYQREGDKHGEAVTVNNLGLLHQGEGELMKAEQQYRRALDVNRSLEEVHAQAANLANLGTVLEEQGRHQEAASHYQEALALDKRVEDRNALADDLVNLGRLAERQGETWQAIEFLDRAYRAYRALGKREQARATVMRLLILAREAGDEQALATYGSQLEEMSSKDAPAPEEADNRKTRR